MPACSSAARRRSAALNEFATTYLTQGDLEAAQVAAEQSRKSPRSSPPPTQPTPSGSATSPSAGTGSATCGWPRATCRAPSRPTPRARTSPTSSPPPTRATPSGSATSRSAGTGSATCGWPRATCRAPSRPSPRQEHPRQARRRRPRQHRVAARPLHQLGQARQRAGGPGRPARRPPGLHRSKNIRDKLAAADPGNAEWQRDLSISWNKLGDVRRAQGDLPGALQAFTDDKNIADKLAAADPGNADWQRDLIVSWNLADRWTEPDPRPPPTTGRGARGRPHLRLGPPRPCRRRIVETWSTASRPPARTRPATLTAGHPLATRPDGRSSAPVQSHPRPPRPPAAPLPALAPLGLPARRGPWSAIPTIAPRSRTTG